jgi:hypothetical protein
MLRVVSPTVWGLKVAGDSERGVGEDRKQFDAGLPALCIHQQTTVGGKRECV